MVFFLIGLEDSIEARARFNGEFSMGVSVIFVNLLNDGIGGGILEEVNL